MSPSTPSEVDERFAEYVNNNNLDALVALYEPNAVLVMPGEEHRGLAAIRAALAALASDAGVHIQMRVVRSIEAGPDLAILYNDWSATMPGNQTMAGKAIEIVRRQPDGSWRFLLDDPYARG